MAKNWWFKFEYRIWQSDPELSQCSLGARGFWLEMVCAMHSQNTDRMTGSFEKLARMARCESSEVAKYALELKETNAANVTLGHGDVTLVSRRLKRELSSKENNRLRKQRERGHADVTPQSKSNKKEVINKSKKEEGEEAALPPHTTMKKDEQGFPIPDGEYPLDDLMTSFPNIEFTPAMLGHVESDVKDTPLDREAWASTLELYRRNYDPMTRSYVPTRIGTLLNVFKDEKSKLEKQANGNGKSEHANTKALREWSEFAKE